MIKESAKRIQKKPKRKLTTAYMVKMGFCYIMLVVLGVAATLKLLHVLGIHLFR